MESGEISQEEIMKEAGDLFSKMKDMKGTSQFNEIFKNMAKQMGMNGMKPNTNAMEQKMKSMQVKEKLRKRLQNKKEMYLPSQDKESSDSSFFQNGEQMMKDFANLASQSSGEKSMNPFQEIENIMKNLGLSDSKETPNTPTEPSNTNKHKKKNKKR
jgi:hypothetical protein